LRYLDNYQRDGVKFISKEVTRITGWTSKEESKELAVVNPSEESDKE
jgi:hypothetical protein